MATAVKEKQNVTKQQLLLVVGLLVVLLGALWFLVLKGGGDEVPQTPVADTTAEDPEAPGGDEVEEPDPDGGGKKDKTVETLDVFAPKDPFKPLIAAAPTGDSGDGSSGGDPTGDTGSTGGSTGGTTSPGGGGPSGPPSGPPGSGPPPGDNDDEPSQPETVTVRTVKIVTEDGVQKARIKFNKVKFDIAPGETFDQYVEHSRAGHFKVMSIQGRCANLLYADEEFTLCRGEEIVK